MSFLPIQSGGIQKITSEIKMNDYYIYILASKRNGTIYIGVTNHPVRRVYEHKTNIIKEFTSKYNIHQLVYYEHTNDIQSAISREKQLKNRKRKWKLKLIEELNPKWLDLYEDII